MDEGQDGTMSDSAVGGSVATPARRGEADAKRRKSIMTRLIPGRANSAQNVNGRQLFRCFSVRTRNTVWYHSIIKY